MGTAKLRIRIFELIDEYQRLLYSNLSLHYFNKNHKTIKEICRESENEFKQFMIVNSCCKIYIYMFF